jgi:hypothetical protein
MYRTEARIAPGKAGITGTHGMQTRKTSSRTAAESIADRNTADSNACSDRKADESCTTRSNLQVPQVRHGVGAGAGLLCTSAKTIAEETAREAAISKMDTHCTSAPSINAGMGPSPVRSEGSAQANKRASERTDLEQALDVVLVRVLNATSEKTEDSHVGGASHSEGLLRTATRGIASSPRWDRSKQALGDHLGQRSRRAVQQRQHLGLCSHTVQTNLREQGRLQRSKQTGKEQHEDTRQSTMWETQNSDRSQLRTDVSALS